MGYEALYIYIDEEGLSGNLGFNGKWKVATPLEFFRLHGKEPILFKEDHGLVIGLKGRTPYEYNMYIYQKDGTLKPFDSWYDKTSGEWRSRNYVK